MHLLTVKSVFLIYVLYLSSCNTLRVFTPGEIEGKYDSPGWRELSHLSDDDFIVNGSLVVSNPPHACSGVTNADDFRDKIVIAYHGGRCSPLRKIRFIQEKGGKGMIFVRTGGFVNVGIPCLWTDHEDTSDVKIPMVCAWPKDGDMLSNTVRSGNDVYVQLEKDRNEWLEFTKGAAWIIWQIFFSLFFGGLCGFAGYKLFLFIKDAGGIKPSLAQMSLSLELIANVLRLAYVAIDPQYSRNIYTFSINNSLFTLSMPFQIASALLLTFYWQEIASKAFPTPTLNKLRIPFAITVIVVLILEIVSNYFRSDYWENGFVLNMNGYTYLLLLICLSVFYWSAGIRLLRAVKERSQVNENTVNRTAIMVTKILTISTVGMMLTVVGIVMFIAPVYARPWGNCLSWTVMFGGMGVMSIAFITAFRAPRSKSSSQERASQFSTARTGGSSISMSSKSGTEQEPEEADV